MSVALIVNSGVQHPAEGRCLAINLTAGVAANLDCSAFATDGEMVSVINTTTLPLGLKFSSSATPNINVAATSGVTACGRMPPLTRMRGFIPYGQPHLHLLASSPGYVYVQISSVYR